MGGDGENTILPADVSVGCVGIFGRTTCGKEPEASGFYTNQWQGGERQEGGNG